MSEKPILFSTEMVKAILDERKTQTRRIIKPQPEFESGYDYPHENELGIFWKREESYSSVDELIKELTMSSPWQPGDTLWVRETWYYENHMHELTAGEPDLPSGRYSHRYIFKADCPDYPVNVGVGPQGWKPSIHMPREAARLFLTVKNIRVERLQAITEEDAYNEGVTRKIWTDLGIGNLPVSDENLRYREGFKLLWNSIYQGQGYGWDSNPWLLVIKFERKE